MRTFDPDECDQGPPYLEIAPPTCYQCGGVIRISKAIIDSLRGGFVWECWCGAWIDFERVQ